MRDYYDDKKKQDFPAILDANKTNMLTNIPNINQVFLIWKSTQPSVTKC